LFVTEDGARAGAARTTYPVVFAHGMAGFDDILGYDYWGDDYGTFVGDPCDAFLEVYCNGDIDSGQKAYVAQVQPFQTSEVRGLDLANDIEGFMATAGASRVNLVGHSQGGLDIRKAARVLYERRGYTVVSQAISISSPHRGSPVAKYILDLKPGVTSVIAALATYYGNVVYQSGNDAYAGAKQLVYNDYSSTDGVTTGMRAFNAKYPVDSRYASRYVADHRAGRPQRQPRALPAQQPVLRHRRRRLLPRRLRQRRRGRQGRRLSQRERRRRPGRRQLAADGVPPALQRESVQPRLDLHEHDARLRLQPQRAHVRADDVDVRRHQPGPHGRDRRRPRHVRRDGVLRRDLQLHRRERLSSRARRDSRT
jgi:hypothetical protein